MIKLLRKLPLHEDADTSINNLEDISQQQPKKKKAKKATAPMKISVKWVVEEMVFRTTYEVVNENVWTALVTAVQNAKEMVQQLTSTPVINSSFLFKLTQQELHEVIRAKLVNPTLLNRQLHQCKSLGWLKTDYLKILQLPSAPSFVFQLASKSQPDKSCIVKYFVHSTSKVKFLEANLVLGSLDETDIQRFCMPLISVDKFHIFEQLLPPLTNLNASLCMQYLCKEVRKSLELMHSMECAHLDVRLPNICYRRRGDDYIPVLIDYERVDDANECSAHLYVSSDLYPPKLKNKYTDYVQLFAIASVSKGFITTFVMAALQSNFSPTDLGDTFSAFIRELPEDRKSITEILTSRT